jgi:hypothetical protein
MIRHTAQQVLGEDLTARLIPRLAPYLDRIHARPHVQTVLVEYPLHEGVGRSGWV